MSKILMARQLSKLYHSGTTPVLALDQVNCEIEQGEFLAITGPSGAGKSTLLNILAGLDKPDQGKVDIAGVSIYDISEAKLARFRNRKIGYIFQAYNLLGSMTVIENCRLPQNIAGIKPDKTLENKVFDQLGLTPRLRFYPDQLSGGEQQRVAIARAVLMHPVLIIADEPTGNLDSSNSQQFMMMMREMNKTFGQTLIMVTHDSQLASQADRFISIRDGRIEDSASICIPGGNPDGN